MKRLILLAFVFLLAVDSPAPTRVQRGQGWRKSIPAAGGGCDGTNRDAEASTLEDFVYMDSSGITRFSSQFTTGASTYTICSAVLRLKRTGTVSGNLTVGIYSNNSGLAGTLVGSASSNVAGGTVPTSDGDVTFLNISATLSPTTTYHVVLSIDSSPGAGAEIGVAYADEAGIAIAFYDGTWNPNYVATSRIIFQLKS